MLSIFKNINKASIGSKLQQKTFELTDGLVSRILPKVNFIHRTSQKFRVAEDIAIRGIYLPSFPELKKEQVLEVSEKIKEFYK